jgi:hypothetical protein
MDYTALQHYIPEDSTLHNHHCENLNSYIVLIYLMSQKGIIEWGILLYDDDDDDDDGDDESVL